MWVATIQTARRSSTLQSVVVYARVSVKQSTSQTKKKKQKKKKTNKKKVPEGYDVIFLSRICSVRSGTWGCSSLAVRGKVWIGSVTVPWHWDKLINSFEKTSIRVLLLLWKEFLVICDIYIHWNMYQHVSTNSNVFSFDFWKIPTKVKENEKLR